MSNPEYKLQFRILGKFAWVVVFALLYALGGIHFKWIRRFIAPVWLGGGMYLFSRDWRVFLQVPLQFGALSMGYGADMFWEKIGRRLLFGFANGFTNITHLFDKNFDKKRFWTLFGIAIIANPLLIAVLGAINPVVARAEEMIIGFLIGVWSIFIIKDKES
jgi:hypothetical protein